jgi:hypothetical protein
MARFMHIVRNKAIGYTLEFRRSVRGNGLWAESSVGKERSER